MESTGLIKAVCTSPESNVPKYPRGWAVVNTFGFIGDYHCRPTRRSHQTGKEVPNNDRHLTIVGEEVLEHANEKLGLSLKPGDLGENICTSGLGDLSDVPEGARFLLNDGNVIFEVVGQNVPCKKLLVYHRLLPKTIVGRRGVLCVVAYGLGQTVEPGSPIILTW